jgi:hypothetical protein
VSCEQDRYPMANTFAGGRLNREGIYRHLGFPDHVLRAGHYAVAHGCQRASRRVIIGEMLVQFSSTSPSIGGIRECSPHTAYDLSHVKIAASTRNRSVLIKCVA